MKTLSICAVILFSIFSFNTSSAQTVKKETIKVWGNCGMCKTKIEKAARSAGAATANWNEDSKELKVSYAVNKTSGTKIQQAIAKTGYDTQDFTADDKTYEKLHACCQYERKDMATTAVDKKCCANTSCKHDDKEGECKKDMAAGQAKSCCNKNTSTANAKKSCENTSCKHDGKSVACKDMACCKEKTCCEKTVSMD